MLLRLLDMSLRLFLPLVSAASIVLIGVVSFDVANGCAVVLLAD